MDIALLHFFWPQLVSVHTGLSDWFVFLEANGFIVEFGISSGSEIGEEVQSLNVGRWPC